MYFYLYDKFLRVATEGEDWNCKNREDVRLGYWPQHDLWDRLNTALDKMDKNYVQISEQTNHELIMNFRLLPRGDPAVCCALDYFQSLINYKELKSDGSIKDCQTWIFLGPFCHNNLWRLQVKTALCMGTHKRLGCESKLRSLSADNLKMIVSYL